MTWNAKTPTEIKKLYDNGLVAAPVDTNYRDMLTDTGIVKTGMSIKHLVKDNPGAGKRALLWRAREEYDPGAFGEESQTTGDCRKGDTLVRMADGTRQQLKDIQVGEYVLSGQTSIPRKVVRLIKKEYNKQLVSIDVDGWILPMVCTRDHQLLVWSHEEQTTSWVTAENVTDDMYLIIGKDLSNDGIKYTFDLLDFSNDIECVVETSDFKQLRTADVEYGKIRAKNSHKSISRYIHLDEKLAWLVGLYAAEGSGGDKHRVTFNLGAHERDIINRAKSYVEEIFGIECHAYSVPSKPTVTYVRCQNILIGNLFKYLCSGNTYSKQLSREIFTTNNNIKIQVLKGWLDGDGHLSKKEHLSGVSVSKNLIIDMFTLANDCGLRITTGRRPAYKQSKEFYTVNIGRCSTHALYDVVKRPHQHKNLIPLGQACLINDIQDVPLDDEYVYCIEVEVDHSFISDGYVIKNCTSHGDRNARDVTRAVEIFIKGEAEEYYKRGATEPTYGYRGSSGQGMDPGRAAAFVTKYGWMVRENYSGCVNLTEYDSRTGSSWGRGGPPKCVLDACSDHPVGEYISPSSADEAMALFQNGYACHSGQNVGFADTPGSDGIHRRSGSWNHDMATVGYDDTKEIWKERVYFVANSWGDYNNAWDKWVNDRTMQHVLGPTITGMIVVAADVWERYFLGGRSIYFYSDIQGFPAKTIPSYGTETFL